MTERVRVRVTLEGKTPKYDLFVEGFKALDLDYFDVLNLALNATSALRWSLPNNVDDTAALTLLIEEGGRSEEWPAVDESVRLHYKLKATKKPLRIQ